MAETYSLDSSDLEVLEAVELLIRKMTESKRIRPAQLVSLAKLLHVVQTVPEVFRSVLASASISMQTNHDGFREKSYWRFSAFEGRLNVSTGGSTYDPAVGSDSFSQMVWSISPGEKSDYNGQWDEQWMSSNLTSYPRKELQINLESGDYEFSIEDHDNPLLNGEDEEREGY